MGFESSYGAGAGGSGSRKADCLVLDLDGNTFVPTLTADLAADVLAELTAECNRVFDEYEADVRYRKADRVQFRYEMYNRSAAVQRAIGHPRILETIEPLLGEDCHVIANTCWRNPPDHGGGPWHCDVVPAWLPGPACVGRISSSAVGWISSSTISPVARALLGRFGAGSYTLRNPERIAAVRINQNGFSCFT